MTRLQNERIELLPALPKRFSIPLLLTAVVAVTAIGLIVWMAADPQYWFPGAYAAKGERGDVGPRGRQGPPGPPGPDAATAIDDLSSTVDDLSSRLDDLETGTGDQAASSVDDLKTALTDLCDAISVDYRYAIPGSELESVLDDLNTACP